MDQDEIETNLHDLIMDLCRVMHDHGYTTVRVGDMMRLMGVPEERASGHDDEYIDLLEHFAEKDPPVSRTNQQGQTLH